LLLACSRRLVDWRAFRIARGKSGIKAIGLGLRYLSLLLPHSPVPTNRKPGTSRLFQALSQVQVWVTREAQGEKLERVTRAEVEARQQENSLVVKQGR